MEAASKERTCAAPWPGASVEFVETATVPSLRVARIGDGAPLLLINGLGANLEMWQPLVTALMLTPARYWSRQAAELIVPIIAGGRRGTVARCRRGSTGGWFSLPARSATCTSSTP